MQGSANDQLAQDNAKLRLENVELRSNLSRAEGLQKDKRLLQLKNEELQSKASRVDILEKDNEELRLKVVQDDSLREECERLKLENAQLRSRASSIDILEIVRLRQSVTTRQTREVSDGSLSPTGRVEEPIQQSERRPRQGLPQEAYDQLLKRYCAVHDECAKTKRALETLVAKYRGEKEIIDAWIGYYKKQNPGWQEKHAKLKSIRGPEEDESSDSTQAAEPAVRNAETVRTSEAGAQEDPGEDRAVVKREEECDLPVVVSERTLRRKKPQSTNLQAHTNGVHQQGTPDNPVRVKDEPASSSPVANATLGDPISESMNLDEVGPQVRTPRRNPRKRQLDVAGLTTTAEQLELDSNFQDRRTALRDSPTPAPRSKSAEHPNQDAQSRNSDHPRKRRRSSSKASRGNHDSAKESEEQDVPTVGHTDGSVETVKLPRHPMPLNSRPATAAHPANLGLLTPGSFGEEGGGPTSQRYSAPPEMKSARSSEQQNASGRKANVLRPTSSNLKLTPLNTGLAMTKKRNSRRRTSNIADVASVTEDGEVTPSVSPEDVRAMGRTADTGLTPPTTGRGKLHGPAVPRRRLMELLEQPPPGTPELTPSRPAGSSNHHRELPSSKEGDSAEPRNDLPQTALLHDSRSSAKHRTGDRQKQLVAQWSASATPSNNSKNHVRTLSSSKPLRALPLHELQLEHFKVNSNYNQGLDYAFTETVRRHDQRRCLPGCTRPECCGDLFRKSVQIGGLPTGQRSELRWGSSPPQSEDDRVLEEYLGADRSRLRSMADDKKQELLRHAKAKQFADKHGKHRQAYERRKTPPGFWRTEMPTTQEIEADREEAARLERAQVEERYREAMRPGGRWVFADERQK